MTIASRKSHEMTRSELGTWEGEERFRLLADTAPIMMWMSGADKLCTYFNRSWLEFTGRPISIELGDGWSQGVHPEDLERCMQTYVECFDRREEFKMEYRLRRHDGRYRWIFDVGVPRYSSQGTFEGFIGSCVDITDRKEIESERITMRVEIAQLNRAASMSQLAASLAHELAQPLAAILSNAQAASRYANMPVPDLGEIRAALAEIAEDDHRAKAFVETMRSMFTRQRLSRVRIDLNQVIREVGRIIRIDAVRRGVEINLSLGPEAVLVIGDAIAVQQVVLNLSNNGMDATAHMPPGERRLTVSTQAQPARELGTIRVEDNGHGVSAEIREKLFTPFFTTKRDGLGLGLSISRSLIESLGGRIGLMEMPGPGAAFEASLPLADGEGTLESIRGHASAGACRNT